MSAIDHASVQVPPALAVKGQSRRRLTPPVRVALAFVAAQVPLALAAIALEWRDSGAASTDPGPIVGDVLAKGSAISGPLGAQLIILTLVVLATRTHRTVRLAGTAGLGIFGVLIVINGARSALADHIYAPQAVGVVAGIGFVLAGLTFITLAIRELRR